MYKMIAIDMDGTLLNNDRKISKQNKKAIKKAIEKGTRVVITSGRGLAGLNSYLTEIDLIGENQYLIANNGGTIYRTSDFKCISYKGLKKEDLLAAHELSLDLGLNMIAYTHEGPIAAEENEFTKFEASYVGTPVKILDFYTDVNENDEITKILFAQTEDLLNKIILKIPNEFSNNYSLVRTMPEVLEVMQKDCNKGYGVKALADTLGISSNEIICIGDQANDIEMITFAGLGIAMGNAIDELKNAAQYVTSDNDHNGVAKAIEKFIL